MRGILAVFATVAGNRELRRVELAFAGFSAAEMAVWIAMLVYAYDQGGVTTAGVVALVQLVPAAIFAPFGGVLADRHEAGRVLAVGYAAQAVGMGATAVSLLAGGPPALSYALAALAATAVTVTRPTQAVVCPALARTPDELTAVNVVSGWIEAAGVLVAPALAGLILTVSSPGAVFALFAASAALSALLIAPVRTPRPQLAFAGGQGAGVARELSAGFATLGSHGGVRLLVLLLAAQFVVIGALDVLYVVLAVDVLDLGNPGAGYLNAAFGAGGIAATAVTAGLVGRRRLIPAFLGAAGAAGLALTAIGVASTVVTAFLLLAVAGGACSTLDVAGRTLLQRIAPPDVLARVFGLVEGLAMAGLALGSIAVPLLVAFGGAQAALVAAGLVVPVLAVARLRPLLRLDAGATVPIVEISLLRTMRIFAPLPPPAIEGLARSLEAVEEPAGTVIVRQGEVGDRYYAIADGRVEVAVAGRPVTTLERGEGFGEIALLRDVPRTATVTAATGVRLYALEKEPFLVAVTGHAPAKQAADEIAAERSGSPSEV